MGYLSRLTDVVTTTTKTLHIYVNGTSGSDTNEGLTVGSPKKTLTAAFNMVPYIIGHHCAIHLAGTIDLSNESNAYSAVISRYMKYPYFLVIDGGRDTTTVAGPFTATASSIGTLTVNSAGWTADQYAGYWIEITNAGVPDKNKNRLIVANTTDTLTAVREWPADPGNVTFNIVRPATTITKTTGSGEIVIQNTGVGLIALQNVYIANKSITVRVQNSPGVCYLSHVVSDSTNVFPFSVFTGQAMAAEQFDPATFGGEYGVNFSCAGIGWRSPSFGNYINVNQGVFNLAYSYAGCYTIREKQYGQLTIASGTRLWMLTLSGVVQPFAPVVANYSGYARTKIGKGDVGILALSSQFIVGAGVEVTDNTYDGIRIRSSNMVLEGDVKGSANGQYGVKATLGSTVATLAGTPPTITGGTSAFLIWTGGGTVDKTWANLETDGYILSPDQMPMFNKGY